MTEIYETAYGIYNHVANAQAPRSKKRPFASVAFHKGEDVTETSEYKSTMRLFRDLPIKDIFHIDYIQFMKLPVPVMQDMVELAKEKQNAEAKIVQNADNTMKKSLAEHQASQTNVNKLLKNKKR